MLNDFLAFGQALIEAGGWTVVVVMVLVFIFALRRGWVVWDWQFKAVVDDVKLLKITVSKLTAELARERRRKDPPRGPG